MKFICKDFWTCVFKKQIDNLRTNHQVTLSSEPDRFINVMCQQDARCWWLSSALQAQPRQAGRYDVFKTKVCVSEIAVLICFRASMFSRTTSSGYWVSCQQGNSIWNKPQRCAALISVNCMHWTENIRLYLFLWDNWAQTIVTSHGSRLQFKDLNCKTSNNTQCGLNGKL